MNVRKEVFVAVVSLSFCVLCSGLANAHMLWINAVDYAMQPGAGHSHGEDAEGGAKLIAQTNVYFGFGHSYPVDDFLKKEMLNRFELVDSNHNKKPLEPNPGGFLATSIGFEKPGPYIVSAAIKPGYYTMHIEKGHVQHKMGPKTGLKAVILSLYYEQYTKALLAVGDTTDDAFAKPIGDKIEIVPLKNPYNLKAGAGEILPVQVWFNGRPASFCKVYATYAGFSTGDDFALATTADSKGTAHIRLTHWGPWLVKAEKMMPATEELKDKCNTLHYTASLTFEIK
ncbi:MAG: hypothetical protein DRP62_05810 [Planctomycetota bacterium]|nr:MAG: hypothetical protein DRP62_05810 [Planctomycetota bacterium]